MHEQIKKALQAIEKGHSEAPIFANPQRFRAALADRHTDKKRCKKNSPPLECCRGKTRIQGTKFYLPKVLFNATIMYNL